MSALSRFEELIERVLEGSLVGLFGATVQPVEMAKRLARAMENERAIGVGRSIAPNDYTVALHPEDFARFAPIQRSLERELEDYLRQAAQERQLGFLVRPTVRLEAAESVGRHQIRVAARMVDRPAPAPEADEQFEHTQRFQAVVAPEEPRPEPAPPPSAVVHELVARADGVAYPLGGSVVTLGRALDNDLVLEDTRVSRYHLELRLQEERLHLRDLRSTNGTFLNGRPVAEATLKPGDVISLGGLELLYQTRKDSGVRRGA